MATLVAGTTVGITVWFVVTGVALTCGLLGPVGNVQADKFRRRWVAGTVVVGAGCTVAVIKGEVPGEGVVGCGFWKGPVVVRYTNEPSPVTDGLR